MTYRYERREHRGLPSNFLVFTTGMRYNKRKAHSLRWEAPEGDHTEEKPAVRKPYVWRRGKWLETKSREL